MMRVRVQGQVPGLHLLSRVLHWYTLPLPRAAAEQVNPCDLQYSQSVRLNLAELTTVTVAVGPVRVSVYSGMVVVAPTTIPPFGAELSGMHPCPTPERLVPQR